MSQDNKKYKRIRAEDAAQLMGWDLPQMGGEAVVALARKESVDQVTVVEEEIVAEKITAAELESIRETARLEGLSAGLEEGRQQGLEEGRQAGQAEGHEQGYNEGIAQAGDEIERARNILQQSVAELVSPLEQTSAQLEASLLSLVVRLSEAVVGHELAARKELLSESIRTALNQVPEPLGRVEITVNPADQDYVSLPSLSSDDRLVIHVDESIQPGGYLLSTGSTFISHEVEARFQAVAEQLVQSLTNPEGGVDDEQNS